MPEQRPLRVEWERHAADWVAFARTDGHDTFYWDYNEPALLELLPPPGGLTVDVGCGEGRFARAMMRRGHRVIGIDGSMTLARLAATDEHGFGVAQADTAALPIADSTADLVVSCMVLMDVEHLDDTVAELARILKPDGLLCVAIMHPIQSAGIFLPDDPNRTFYLGEYRREMRHVLRIERDGLGMTFNVEHRPLEVYSRAFERSGLTIAAIREPVPRDEAIATHPELSDCQRVPAFLHLVVKHLGNAVCD